MGFYRGPNIVKDNLVFGYDTGYGIANNNTSTRFYPGRPTTNMASPDLKDWGIESGAQRIATGNYYKGQPTYNCRGAVGSPWLAIYNVATGVRTAAGSGGTVTMSIWVKNNNSSTIITSAYMGHDFSSNRSISPNADWQRIQWTVNQSSMGSDYCEFRPNTGNSNTYLEFTMPQIEVNVGNIATPWTPTSRSNTQSLIDLTRTTDMSMSNVSFDLTGQPTFDGTDDSIVFNPGTFPNSWNSPFSVEAVVYIPSDAVWYKQGSGLSIVGRGSYTGSWGLLRAGSNNVIQFWMRTGGNTFNPGGTINRDKYYHILGTWDGTSQAIFYINGVQNSQETSTNVGTDVDNTGNVVIGGNIAFGGNNGGYGEGTYPIIKLYSKALSATEVKQNFNAIKNRFNI